VPILRVRYGQNTFAHTPRAPCRWADSYAAARTALTGRAEAVAAAAEAIETRLQLLGCTAIEDKLQAGVPAAIANLAAAGIRLWVLTGDKQAGRPLPHSQALTLHAGVGPSGISRLARAADVPLCTASCARRAMCAAGDRGEHRVRVQPAAHGHGAV